MKPRLPPGQIILASRPPPNPAWLKQRWVIERGFAHLHNFRRLRIRYERYPEIHTALLILACSILC
jgi:transposase